jgi:4-diphosphocytidyl-2-C-methyl-D-erythritol kinase
VVRARHPEVAAALDWLGGHACAMLTGTGSCVFAAVDSAGEARRIAQAVPRPWTSYAVRGLARSPLHERLNA